MVSMVLALAVVFGLGIALLALGLRGRRIDDHPVCRRCQFDLIGVFPAITRCPECGQDLSFKTVRTGQRQKRQASVSCGIGCLSLALCSGMLRTRAWAIGVIPHIATAAEEQNRAWSPEVPCTQAFDGRVRGLLTPLSGGSRVPGSGMCPRTESSGSERGAARRGNGRP